MAKPSVENIAYAEDVIDALRLGMSHTITSGLDAKGKNEHDYHTQMIRDMVVYTKTGKPDGLEAQMVLTQSTCLGHATFIRLYAREIGLATTPETRERARALLSFQVEELIKCIQANRAQV